MKLSFLAGIPTSKTLIAPPATTSGVPLDSKDTECDATHCLKEVRVMESKYPVSSGPDLLTTGRKAEKAPPCKIVPL
jgi:hypothetical protein